MFQHRYVDAEFDDIDYLNHQRKFVAAEPPRPAPQPFVDDDWSYSQKSMVRSCRLRIAFLNHASVDRDGSWPVNCMHKFIRKYRNRILFFFLLARNGRNLGLGKNNTRSTPRTPLCAAAILAQRCRATATCLLHHSTRLACEIWFLSP